MAKKILITILGLALCGMAGVAGAAETGAGCGIGKMLFDGKSGKSNNIVASILNTILIPNTSFMTTAASMNEEILGCDPSKTVLREEQKQIFVAANIDNLSRDMAQGSGPHLEALATIMGIDEADRPSFYELSQEEFASLAMADTHDPAAVIAALDSAMQERQGQGVNAR